MSQRVKARGQVSGAWTPTGTHDGPPGSGIRITTFVADNPAGGSEHNPAGIIECADIEEAVGRSSKRRLARITGLHTLNRAFSWVDGYLLGRAGPSPVTQYARPQPKKKT
jgi:hypothetical protein